MSYAEIADRVNAVARGLMALGISVGDRVAILSENRPEWVIADLAIQTVGGITVPLYSTGSVTTVRFILAHSEAKIFFTSDACRNVARDVSSPFQRRISFDSDGFTLEQCCAEGAGILVEEVEARRKAIHENDVATIIYTSGTTGDPKGVMLTHANLISNMEAALKRFKISSDDRTLSFLPLSHALERTAGIFTMLFKGVAISFAQDMTTIARDLTEVRPTILITVPRMLEKFHARVREEVERRPKWLRSLFAKAIASEGRGLLSPLYELLFFRKIRRGFGGRARLVVSGGAALAPEISKFFWTAGVTVLEGYGLTETSPIVAVNPERENKTGTVGPPLPGVEVGIAEDGEILVRGPNVMKGYFRDSAATAEVFDENGWFFTGDIGELDSDGYLTITDRKKDLIITSGGKKVAPQPIENELRTDPIVRHVCLVGEGRNYVAALIVPNFEALASRARRAGLDLPEAGELLKDRRVLVWFEEIIARVNAGRASYETIKRFRLVSRDWTIETGELTPTLKVRRRTIFERHKEEIEELYK